MKKIMSLTVFILGLFLLTACSNTSYNEYDKNSDNKIDIKEYSEAIVPNVKEIQSDLNEVIDIATEGSENPYLLTNKDYLEEVESISDDFYFDIQDVKDLDVGNDSDVKNVHDLILKAMDEFEFVAVNLPVATNNLDSELVQECSIHMKQGGNYFSQASELVLK